MKIGFWECFYDNKKLKFKEEYENNNPIGYWITYHKTGKKRAKAILLMASKKIIGNFISRINRFQKKVAIKRVSQ